jgi:hypothetical protein
VCKDEDIGWGGGGGWVGNSDRKMTEKTTFGRPYDNGGSEIILARHKSVASLLH